MHKTWRQHFKSTAGWLTYKSGLHRVFGGREAVIVAFHTIGEHDNRGAIQVSRKQFREYCSFFKRYFEVVSLGDLLERLRTGESVENCLAITFDDGYRDNYSFAAPELERFGLPATFFVTTGFIGSDAVPWWEDRHDGPEWMSWQDLIDLDRRGFDIGGHTQSHVNLASAPANTLVEEIAGCKKILEDRLGHSIGHFAYPYGMANNISEPGIEQVKAAGFRCCASCYGGSVSATTDPMRLPRLPINEWHQSAYEFGFDLLRPDSARESGAPADRVGGRSILVSSYHLYPDSAVGARRPSEYLRYFRRLGYDVFAVAGRVPRKERDCDLEEKLANVSVKRTWQPPSVIDWLWKHTKRIWQRPESHFGEPDVSSAENGEQPLHEGGRAGESFVRRARRNYNALSGLFEGRKTWVTVSLMRMLLRRLYSRCDVVISSGPPSASHVLGYLLAWLYRARYVMDFRDPWVANGITSPSANSRFREYCERAGERICIRRASAVICTTPDMANQLQQRYPDSAGRVTVVYNGFDEAPAAAGSVLGKELKMLFAGTLYLNRNPFPLLEAVDELVRSPTVSRERVSLTFVGSCEQWQGKSLPDWIASRALEDVVQVLPRVSQKEVQLLTEAATVLVNFAQGQPTQIPAKTFDYLASGKLLLVATESDSATAGVMRKVGVGHIVAGDDTREIFDCLSAMYRTLVTNIEPVVASSDAVMFFSRKTQNERLHQLLFPD